MGNLEKKFVEVCDAYLSSCSGYDLRGEQCVFSFAMVVWLGIQQRLKGNSLKESVRSLVERAKLGDVSFLTSRASDKLRTAEISLNTGGISRARDRYSVESVQELFYSATEQIFSQPSLQSEQRNIYVLDGQVGVIARSESNLEHFGPTGNGEGELHFPRIRIISAHELRSGIAREVAIGQWRSSEVGLSKDVAARLPRGSLLVMDRGFDRPTFLEAVGEQGVGVVVRIKESLAKKLFAGDSFEGSTAQKYVEWNAKASKDRRAITLQGRVIKHTSQIKGFRSSEFYFFTTDDTLEAEEVAEIYRQRVQVEVFIRDIKQTLNMAFIRSRKGDNVEKEILIAYLTFNLLRAVMEDAANATDLPVQRMSFTSTVGLVKTYAALFVTAKTQKDTEKLTQEFYQHMYQSKLPLRTKERSYPRVIKFPRDKYKKAGVVRKSIPCQYNEG